MIEIEDLTKIYTGDIRALSRVSLTIGPGMFGLVGPNGAGKTTLMRILAGLLNPTSGSVRVFGHDVTTSTGRIAVKAQLGYLPQELGVYTSLTGIEFLDYMARLKGVSDKKLRRKQVIDALEQVRLIEAANRRLKTYSGGMKRRIGIAQALLGHPNLVIVDEPTVGLDPEERVRVRNLLSALAANRTVILSSHIIEDISQSCNALAVIGRGKLLFDGSPRQLVQRAQGKVWFIETKDKPPTGTFTIISSVQFEHGTRYRVVGIPDDTEPGVPAEPTLEDGYMWLMQQAQLAV